MWQIDTAPAARVMHRSENHLYLAPHPALQGAVAHYTLSFPAGGPPPAEETEGLVLMPDIGGCFVFTADVAQDGLFWGANTKAVVVPKYYDDVPMHFFVEFLPGGAARLLGAPMHLLADETLLLGDVMPHLRERMCDALYTSGDLGRVLPAVDAVLLGLPPAHSRLEPAAAKQLLSLLGQTAGGAPVRELAARSGYSERQLARIFLAEFGVGVKTCARVLRIHHMLRLLERPAAPLAVLAQQAGYYDQAHLDHDFKAVCGVSPSEYLGSVADFYKEEFKY